MYDNNRIRKIVILAAALIQLCALFGCSSNGEILSEANDDARLFMELSDYTGVFERPITIKNTQSGAFSVALSPSEGKIEVGRTDGNGTYTITVQLKRYSGAFDISWDVGG